MNTPEWLKPRGRNGVRPRVVCADGFNVSIQAGYANYCTPRDHGVQDHEYLEFELGYPSEPDQSLEPYSDDPLAGGKTVFGYVPFQVVDDLIKKHGGLLR